LKKKRKFRKSRSIDKILREAAGWKLRRSKKFPITKKNLEALKRLPIEFKNFFPFDPYTKDGIPQCVVCGTVMEYRGAGENGAVWSCSKGHGSTEE
jgi:hypothetical protein